jgi:DNA-binding MarR family transcriptional regulator
MSENKMHLYESLKAIFLHIDNHEKTYLSEHGLNVPRFYILLHVSHNPGINYIDLSDRLLCTKSNTSRVVQGMYKDGLITRENDLTDRRSFQLYLTEKGSEILARVLPGFTKQVESLMSVFSEQETLKFLEVSQHIESSLSPDSSLSLTNSQVLSWHNGNKRGAG